MKAHSFELLLIKDQEGIRTIAFDRILTMDTTEERFTIPKKFNAKKLFSNRRETPADKLHLL